MFPTIGEYNDVIDKKGGQAFYQLNEYQFKPSRLIPVRIFIHGTGSYAVVFKAVSSAGLFAIKCFIGGDTRNAERYRQLDRYLAGISAPWLTSVKFLEDEIRVNGGLFPVVKMPWIDGVLLNDFITINLHHNSILAELQRKIIDTSRSLESNHIGHGDIQCGNILVSKASGSGIQLKLIDYDGMYIPAFTGNINLERGRAEFQHPKRGSQQFNERIDRFSFWVILATLEGLKHDKGLWEEVLQGGFNTLDNMLFTGDDFLALSLSPLFRRLNQINQPSMQYYLIELDKACSSDPDEVSQPALYLSLPENDKMLSFEQFIPKTTTIIQSLLINSTPPGALVLADYKNIGITPCRISKSEYKGHNIILTQGTQVRSFIVGDQDDINFEFAKAQNLDLKYKMEGTHPSFHTKHLSNSQPVYTKTVQGSNDTIMGTVAIVIIIVIVIVVIFSVSQYH